jgi:hypothetical protein
MFCGCLKLTTVDGNAHQVIDFGGELKFGVVFPVIRSLGTVQKENMSAKKANETHQDKPTDEHNVGKKVCPLRKSR